MAAVAVAPPPALPLAARSLYDIEAHLAALIDSEELLPAEEQEYAIDLQATLLATVEKRDRLGHFMAHLESQLGIEILAVARPESDSAAGLGRHGAVAVPLELVQPPVASGSFSVRSKSMGR